MSSVGLDIGTSSVKAARFDSAGRLLAHSVQSLPAIVRRGLEVTQSLEAVLYAADRALHEVAGDASRLAYTTQRDTLVLDDTLVSWRDGRAGTQTFWDVVDPAPFRRVHSLVSRLSTHWTGVAAETPSTWSRHLRGAARERYEQRDGPALPNEIMIGQSIGRHGQMDVFPTAGDKNCELLGNGICGSHAGLSLGSAVSLGMLTDRATPVGGVFESRAPVRGHQHVETGLIVGMSAMEGFSRWWPMAEAPCEFVDDLFVLPHFAGALDGPAKPIWVGLQPDTPGRAVVAAWSQGIVAELRRLRPALETAAGTPLESIVVSGGGSVSLGWSRLLANAMNVPVFTACDRFAGCRGAVEAVRLARGEPVWNAPPRSHVHPTDPTAFDTWYEQWHDLFLRNR